jgi:hypothetical protein
MTFAIAAVGILIAALGLLGLIRPSSLIDVLGRTWRSRTGLYVAIAFRAGLGALLIAAADLTRFPRVMTVLGVLSLATAVSLPVLGYERLNRFVQWWSARSPGFIRGWSAVACASGLFLIYAVI